MKESEMTLFPPNNWADRMAALLTERVGTTGHAFEFIGNCAFFGGEAITEMVDAAEEAEYAAMAELCDLAGADEIFNGDSGIHLLTDWRVSFYKSRIHGVECYYFNHSRIEWIYVPAEKREEMFQHRRIAPRTVTGRFSTHRPNPYGVAWQDRVASGDPPPGKREKVFNDIDYQALEARISAEEATTSQEDTTP